MNNKTLGAIILAGGKGKRMKSKHLNKVVLPLANKPMILHEIEFLQKLALSTIVVVVGFAKESVKNVLKGNSKVTYAFQKKRLGTAHAVLTALPFVPKVVQHVLVIQGDDSFFYQNKNIKLVKKLIKKHLLTNASMTFLTIELENPHGIGRIIRDSHHQVTAIMEEKDATAVQRMVKEVNIGCYLFKKTFLQKYLKKIKKSPITREYYLVSLVELANLHKEKIEILFAGKISWRGINTPEELSLAEKLYLKK